LLPLAWHFAKARSVNEVSTWHRWRFALVLSIFLVTAAPAVAQDTKAPGDKAKAIAGEAEFLRGLPKHFATLLAVESGRHGVTLLVEGDTLPKTWNLVADAEIKVAGWWGRLDQLRSGDRVWVWFKTDRKKQPVAVCMLADELSEQDMHGGAVTLAAVKKDSVTLKALNSRRRLVTTKAEVYQGSQKRPVDSLRPDDKVYLQSAGGQARLILDSAAFEARRAAQQVALRKHWTDEGLPGAITFLHIFSGEMEIMLDHEAMRWGRSLHEGDLVHLKAEPPIAAVVNHVEPWRERTLVRLVVHGLDQAELAVGQRVHLQMTPPPREVQAACTPPDLDRPRARQERIEWFLASIYCTCKIGGDGCTGQFYTLASCNPNGCGMPDHMRHAIAEKIEGGLTDRQIFEQLVKSYGPLLLRPHLVP
jgi:hypothetical protein